MGYHHHGRLTNYSRGQLEKSVVGRRLSMRDARRVRAQQGECFELGARGS